LAPAAPPQVYCAELARWHLSGQNGLLDVGIGTARSACHGRRADPVSPAQLVWKHKLVFMVGSQHFLYRAPVPAFAKYEIHTQLDAIDNKWMFMRQTFCVGRGHAAGGAALVLTNALALACLASPRLASCSLAAAKVGEQGGQGVL
jgi:hypothetical protein